ncbi:MAG: acylphosphatase [Bdellovibrionales bacterium]|nr:acylphosphatase [Bdellovibrionales bacterium]
MSVCRHFLIEGLVQGVGFRFFVLREAKELKLDGWVRNLLDGRVEALVRGSENAIEALTAKLRKGPLTSRVENLTFEEVSFQGKLSDFTIELDGDVPCQFD